LVDNEYCKKIIKIILLLALGSLLITQIQTLATIEIGVNDIKDTENEIIWTKKIEEELQAENKPYLINYTAAWCITCQANDKVALSRPGVKKFFKENNIKYIVADWTNKNQDILDALKIYGRSGVPLYVYWKPGMQKPEILPALLTENIILDALK
jgi:thiol:disulfide interchange protein DsbD